MFLTGGFSVDLTHHVMHAMGGRTWGFTQELFDDATTGQGGVSSAAQAVMLQKMTDLFPNITAVAASSDHDGASVVGQGCDDQFEFEFALDLLLDGFERLHQQGWSSKPMVPSRERQD
jgi:hypothetical protein